jgi:hypothetical protein
MIVSREEPGSGTPLRIRGQNKLALGSPIIGAAKDAFQDVAVRQGGDLRAQIERLISHKISIAALPSGMSTSVSSSALLKREWPGHASGSLS